MESLNDIPFLATNSICRGTSILDSNHISHENISYASNSQKQPITQTVSLTPLLKKNETANSSAGPLKFKNSSAAGDSSSGSLASRMVEVHFKYLEVLVSTCGNSNLNQEIFHIVFKNQVELAELGIGIGINRKLGQSEMPTIYLFELVKNMNHGKSLLSIISSIIPKTSLKWISFPEDELDLSKHVSMDHSVTNTLEAEANRIMLMSVLCDALYNWFEGILIPKGWMRFGFLFVWDSIEEEANFSMELIDGLRNHKPVSSPEPQRERKKRRKESEPSFLAVDLGVSLCGGMGLMLHPQEVDFNFEKLNERHFINGKGPSSVFVAPNGIEATLWPPSHSYMDKMNILMEGKKMPVSFDSRYLYVPKLWTSNASQFNSLLEQSTKNGEPYLIKADLFWGQINEHALFADGGETGDDSPYLANHPIFPNGSPNEKGGSTNRSKKEGKSTASAPSQDKKKSATPNSSISPKLPNSSSGVIESKRLGASNGNNPQPLLKEQSTISRPTNSDLDINSNLPIDAGFKTQNFGALELDMVDDDDFDFFETKTNSAGSGSAIPGTANSLSIHAGEPTPASFPLNDSNSVIGLSSPPGATPSADPTTPFVFSPPPVITHDTTSPGGTVIQNMYPDYFKSPGYQSFSPPHKSTPATPFGFVQSPNTPGPSYETSLYVTQIAPFHFDAKVAESSLIQNSKATAFDLSSYCDPAWLPFEIPILNQKECGKDGKWNWAPVLSRESKKDKFNLKPFRLTRDSSTDQLHRKKRKGEETGIFPAINILDARMLFPFASSYTPIQKVDIFNDSIFYNNVTEMNDWLKLSLYECITQLYYFRNDMRSRKENRRPPSQDLWKKVKSICFHSIIDGNPTQDSINLSDFLKVEDDEDSNFAIYGTIKLRKKKGKSVVIEGLPYPQLLVAHNTCNIVCNREVTRFWSKCRIAPISGPKHVKWISLFPKSPSVLLNQKIPFYMSQMESMWDMLSFGVFEPCHLANQTVPGLFPVDISEKHSQIYKHIIATYHQKLPSLAENIIQQVLTTPSQYCLVMIWNPFPSNNLTAVFDICCLFCRLIHLIQIGTSNSRSYIMSRVVLEIGYTSDLFSILERDYASRTELEKRCFLNFNRLEKLFDGQYPMNAPAFSIENVKIEPKFSLDYPQNSSPLLLFEPDRIIFLFYGVSNSGDHIFCFWSDSFGEFKHQTWCSKFSNEESLVEFLLDKTFSLVGCGGFIPRLVVSNVNGWTLSMIEVWKLAIHVHSDLLKTEDPESGVSSEEQSNSAATTPTSSASEIGANSKVFPSTPGSAYATPQPERFKKINTRRFWSSETDPEEKSLPILGSLSLISCTPSKLSIWNKLPDMRHNPDEWFTKKSSIQYTPCNKIIPWSNGELPSLAKSWIFSEDDKQEIHDDFGTSSTEGSLLWHWQTDYDTTCFPHWYVSGQTKRTNIIKDILRGLFNQKLTNEREEWIFERVEYHLLLISKIEPSTQ